MESEGIPLERACLLDPKATEVLKPEDRENFDWFLFVFTSVRPSSLMWFTHHSSSFLSRFGGILGDDPPRGRCLKIVVQQVGDLSLTDFE